MVAPYRETAVRRTPVAFIPSAHCWAKPLLFAVILVIVYSLVFVLNTNQQRPQQDVDVFDGFDNETGADRFIVPNIIHFIRFNMTEYTFVDYLCLRAAFLRQKPDFIYIHTDVPRPGEGGFGGKYWNMAKKDKKLMASIRFLHLDMPTEVFGQPLSKDWRIYHGSDVARIRTMMKYGGIYLDNDVLIFHNLDRYRRYEVAINWDEGDTLGSQVRLK